jgi:site-specific DNA recombinase
MKRNANNGDKIMALGYVRVSTVEQADSGLSLEHQERAIRAYCEMRGLELTDVLVDAGVSAGKPLAKRPEGQRLLHEIKTGRCHAVVALKLDRVFRDCAECLDVTTCWDHKGVTLHLVDVGGSTVDTSTAMGKFFLTVMAGAAELERNLIRERTAAAMSAKRERKEYCGGEPPYGWTVQEPDPEDQDSAPTNLVPDTGEQSVLALAHSLRDAGKSLRQIGSELESRGVKTRKGGRWHANTIRKLLQAPLASPSAK